MIYAVVFGLVGILCVFDGSNGVICMVGCVSVGVFSPFLG